MSAENPVGLSSEEFRVVSVFIKEKKYVTRGNKRQKEILRAFLWEMGFSVIVDDSGTWHVVEVEKPL